MAKPRIIFAATPVFSVTALQALIASDDYDIVGVYTQPDRKSGRGQKITASPIKECALAHDLAVFQPLNFKSPDDIAELQALNADLMIVIAYGLLLPEIILQAPKLGCINIHASLLPRWRGAAPIQRAILAGDTETGVCVMKMEKGLDTGPVFTKATIPIHPNMNAQELHDALSHLGSNLLMQTLPQILKSELTAIEQDENLGVSYAHKIEKIHAKIDFTQTAEIIERQIRAFNPFPGAFAYLNDKLFKIWQAEISSTKAPPNTKLGQLFSLNNQLFVLSQAGTLEIKSLQLEGKKITTAHEFLLGHPLDGALLS